VRTPLTPFPVLDAVGDEPWAWPLPTFVGRHVVVPRSDAEQPCTIETPGGATIDGEIDRFDPAAQRLSFRMSPGGPALALPFARFTRLTLTTPLAALPTALGMGHWRLPATEEERSYRIEVAGAAAPLTGTTMGHIDAPELGLFLYPPVNEDRSVRRVFVPRAVVRRVELGLSAVDEAAERWIATKAELVAALQRQQDWRVMPLGEAVLALGLVTRSQLARALAAAQDVPLGQRLVKEGLVSPADLQTALALKMGYPIVDLTRFPIEPEAARLLWPQHIRELRALPLMRLGQQLVVAVDRLSRVNRLRDHQARLQLQFLPAIASGRHIRLAFANLAREGVWSQHGALPYVGFETTC